MTKIIKITKLKLVTSFTLFFCHKCFAGPRYEPPLDKTNKMVYAPIEDSDKPWHPPSLIRVDQPGRLPSLIRVFAVQTKKARVLSYPLSSKRRV